MEPIKEGDVVVATKNCCRTVAGKEYVVKRGGGLTLKIEGCTCIMSWKKVNKKVNGKEGVVMKTVWEVIVIDKKEEKVIVKEVVTGADEKSVFAKVSMKNSVALGMSKFDDLFFVAKKLGSWDEKGDEE